MMVTTMMVSKLFEQILDFSYSEDSCSGRTARSHFCIRPNHRTSSR
ncbi:Protein CBG22432 [Caenorhabditis briggsae]|uniref:Protein CBG22432 n=1 Tax=Caenorhabditis briggsae TaxID=6238 RepID=E3CU91_CAEBR|nr:Protein CBG22432 [Caenorhabditis briggsae]CBX33084.1 Protein CBG22432 [Caenorhabditis briggsae]